MRTGMFVSILNVVLWGAFIWPEGSLAQNDVTVHVNMRVKLLEGVFAPENGDRLILRGQHNGWRGTSDVLEASSADSIYSITVNFDAASDSVIAFKYFIVRTSGFEIREDYIANRTIALTGAPQVAPLVYFDDDQIVDAPVESGKIKFLIDMQAMRELEIFVAADGDTVQVHGAFNSWGFVRQNASLAQDVFDPDLYSLNATVEASPNTPVLHQFVLGRTNPSNPARMEAPLTTGGIGREIVFAASANQTAAPVYFNDVPPQGIVPKNQTVQCTFAVDMRPAMQAGDQAFDPVQHQLFLLLMDPWWAATQGREPGAQNDLQLTDTDQDSVYQVSVAVTGPSYYGMIYRYGYGPQIDALKSIEGGDLAILPSRVRYIRPNGPKNFPDSYALPRDFWQSDPGLPVEAPPFDPAPPANKPPYVDNVLPAQTIPLNNTAYNIDLLGSLNVFRDPNGDNLTFSATVADESVLNVSINGSLLTIQPVKIGTTTIRVKADDKKGGSAETTISVTIVEGNQPPRVINPISSQVLTVGGALYTINLSLIFEDPNGDPMTFRAVSSAPNIAAALVFAGVLRISPLLVGNTTITVTAEDNRGGATGTSFVIDIVSGNQPPRLENEIAAQTLTVDGSPFVRDLNASPSVFSDPNGDSLSYSTTSTNTSVATAELNGTILTISAASVGNSDITIFANDGKGGSESTQFRVGTVADNSNRPPQISNAIDNQLLIEGGVPFSRNLDQPPTVFRDPDSDPMYYTATSSDLGIAEVAVFGSQLSIAPIAQGRARIEVTAMDGFGGAQIMNFSVHIIVNRPPVIQHTPAQSQSVGQPIVVDASIVDDTGVSSALIHYRRGGDSSFNPVAMTNVGGSWQGTLPGGDVTSRGIEYKLEAFDQSQSFSFSPLSSIPIALTGEGESSGSPQPSGSDQNAYRLFSIPFQLFDGDPAAVLVDDLGDYDRKKWRLFELMPDQSYAEYGAAGEFLPGKAFWLVVKEAGKIIDSGSGTTNPTDKEYAIPLQPQWNFIGNPFNFAIPVTSLRLSGADVAPELREFTGAWSDAGAVTAIKPFAGYAIFHNATTPETLYVDPRQQSSAGKSAGLALTGALDWAVRIIASNRVSLDRDNVLGVSALASPNYDMLDKPEPPAVGDYVRLHFSRPQWQMLAHDFSTDIRADFDDGAVWEFQITSAIKEIVTLEFEGLHSVPAEFEVWLFDEALQVAKNLLNDNKYAFAAAGDLRAKTLKIAIGRPGFIAGEQASQAYVPGDFELSQNFPNPFNPNTTIRFGLPEQSSVTLHIYNLLGEKIVTLLSGEKLGAGYHTTTWDGKNGAGLGVASGVYLYRLQAGPAHNVKKMILVR